jgi:hypothetical protein
MGKEGGEGKERKPCWMQSLPFPTLAAVAGCRLGHQGHRKQGGPAIVGRVGYFLNPNGTCEQPPL